MEAPKVDGYRLGTKETFILKLALPAHCVVTGTVIDSAITPGPKLSLEQLPADMLKGIKDKLAELKRAFANMDLTNRGGQGRSDIPPP